MAPGSSTASTRRDDVSNGLRVRAWLPAEGREVMPPAVLLHGTVISGRYMGRLAAELAGSMRVYVPDLPGLGGSNTLAAPPTAGECGGVLAEWMRGEGLDQVTLVGNSYGCQVAAELGVGFAGLVRGLVLIGPTVDPTGRRLTRLAFRSAGVALSEPLPLHLWWLRDLGACGFGHAATYLRAALLDRIEDRLPRLRQPCLVVRGARDRLVSQVWAEEAARMIPRGRLVTVPGAGHAAQFSRPGFVAAAILEWLRLSWPVEAR